MVYEVEVRSFVSDEEYNRLLDFFDKNATLQTQDEQETHYFDTPQDLRIQKNNAGAKIWLKSGKIHDDSRKEIEVHTDSFEKLEELFSALNFGVEIKWFRKRRQYKWKDVTVCLDQTKGYGNIIELEILTEEETKKAHDKLVALLQSLGITLTPKEEFAKKYEYYKKHWKTLI